MSIFDSIFPFVRSVIEQARKLVDDVVTTDEERQKLDNELAHIETSFASKLIELRKSEFYSLIKIGLGGYVIGRSVEKVSPKISDAIKSRNNR